MRKIYIHLSIFLACVFALCGCEDFLDKREDAGGLEESAIYESYETIRGFLDKAYGYMEDWNCFENASAGYSSGRTYIGVLSDEMATPFNLNQTYFDFWSGSWLFTEKSADITEIGNSGRTPVGRAYAALRIINRVINNIDQVPMTDEQKREIMGQAYFFRAWHYFTLLKRYGGMPKIDKVFAGGDDDIPRMTYRESSEWMRSDIDEAIKYLPDTWDDMNYGRPTKLAAMAFKEVALLYEASPLMQNGLDETKVMPYDKEGLKAAAKQAWECLQYIQANESVTGVRLETAEEYKNIFWFPDTQLKQPEHIWTNRHVGGDTERQKTVAAWWYYAAFVTGTGSESFALSCPTLNIVDQYERKGADGIYYPIDDPRSGYVFDFEHAFVDRDPRFYNNISIPGDEWGKNKKGGPYYLDLWVGSTDYNAYLTSKHTNGRDLSGFMCRKFIWPSCHPYTQGNKGATYRGFTAQTVFIRVAQLYLDLAEASFEATGSATARVDGVGLSAEECINIIRNRVGVTDLPQDYVSDANKFREAYRRERCVELMFENHRWWDVRRWMIMHTLFENPNSIYGVKFHPVGYMPKNVEEGRKPDSFTLEKFLMTKETRAFGNMRNYWYPLPQHDVDALDNLKQNPGW